MSINVNYLSLKSQTNTQIGEIELFEIYKPPSTIFPYFYLHQKNITIFSQNWPTLVPYLYSQILEIIDINKNKIYFFPIYSLSSVNKVVTLTFNDSNSLIAIAALIEDRKTYFLENNNSYIGWNKTFTPKNNISINGISFFLANNNYYIDNLSLQNNIATISVTTDYTGTINTTILNSVNIEFGLYRIPNSQSNVYYTGIKNSYFCNNDNNLLKGLKIRSQIMGHAHEHSHHLNNHNHTMQHTHNMNHRHYMYHTHSYVDTVSNMSNLLYGNSYTYYNLYTTYDSSNEYKSTNPSREYTDQSDINLTSDANNITTDTISNNISSNIIEETLEPNNDINSNYTNFVKNSKIIPESYTVYAYIYGQQYIE